MVCNRHLLRSSRTAQIHEWVGGYPAIKGNVAQRVRWPRPMTRGSRLYGSQRHPSLKMERTAGIEPAFSRWQRDSLPLRYVRNLVEP